MATTTQPTLSQIRERELHRAQLSGDVYLDYTGAALYPLSLVRRHQRALRCRVLGNPHSTSPTSSASTEDIRSAKRAILQFFDAPAEYDVVLTANATGAIRLIGEGAWHRLLLLQDNHNSVLGLREAVIRSGGAVEYVGLDDDLRAIGFNPPPVHETALFAFPAQSNFSGVRHPLSMIERAQRAGYRVLLDAASFVPTNRLSLREHRPDFVAISFYKMFGYPTGIGALIARTAALAELHRSSFSGGTVEFASVLTGQHLLKQGVEAFEDGTVNFLAASAVPSGLRFLRRIGMQRLRSHINRLTAITIDRLLRLRHGDGSAAIRLYGPANCTDRGSTIAFNVITSDGRIVPYEDVITRAGAAGVSLRGGCFCNPGAAERAFNYDAATLMSALSELGAGFTHERLRARLGDQPVGAVRASFGYGSSETDIDALLDVLTTFLDRKEIPCSSP